MSSNETVRFGIVGCGRIFKKHYEAVTENTQAAIAAVCDIDKDRAAAAGKLAEVPYYYDYNDMLKNEDIDVVSILTPSGLHPVHTIDIVNKFKKHIVCEKPMALKLEDADNMIRTCDNNGVKLFIVKQNRFNLPVIKLREALEQGRFGRIVMGTVRVRWCRTQEYYDRDKWRGTWAYDGGVITNQASHHIDLLEWMLGEPVSVMAMNGTYLSDIEVDDTSAAIVRFRSGALGIIEATTAARPTDMEGSLSILGEKGSAVIGGFAVNEMLYWKFSEKSTEDKKTMGEYTEMPENVYGFGHKRYIENVIDTLKKNGNALVDGLEGRKSLELINAIYESAETGREVHLRFIPERSKLGRTSEE